MSASGSQRPLVIGTRAPRTVRSQSVAASRIADRSVRTPRPRPIESTYCRRRALIRQIAAAEAAEIVSLVWACLVFPGFPSWNTSRLNRNFRPPDTSQLPQLKSLGFVRARVRAGADQYLSG